MGSELDWSVPPANLKDLKALADDVSSNRDLYDLGYPAPEEWPMWPDGREIQAGEFSYGVGYIPAQFVINAYKEDDTRSADAAIARAINDLEIEEAKSRAIEGSKGHGKNYSAGYQAALKYAINLLKK